jgi:hypothetical protein
LTIDVVSPPSLPIMFTDSFCRLSPQFVSDLDRPFGHPDVMVSLSVTPGHYRAIMVADGRGWNVRIGSYR